MKFLFDHDLIRKNAEQTPDLEVLKHRYLRMQQDLHKLRRKNRSLIKTLLGAYFFEKEAKITENPDLFCTNQPKQEFEKLYSLENPYFNELCSLQLTKYKNEIEDLRKNLEYCKRYSKVLNFEYWKAKIVEEYEVKVIYPLRNNLGSYLNIYEKLEQCLCELMQEDFKVLINENFNSDTNIKNRTDLLRILINLEMNYKLIGDISDYEFKKDEHLNMSLDAAVAEEIEFYSDNLENFELIGQNIQQIIVAINDLGLLNAKNKPYFIKSKINLLLLLNKALDQYFGLTWNEFENVLKKTNAHKLLKQYLYNINFSDQFSYDDYEKSMVGRIYIASLKDIYEVYLFFISKSDSNT